MALREAARLRGIAAARAGQLPRASGADWAQSGLLLVAITAALGGLHSVLGGTDWWVESVAVAGVVLLVAAIVRSFARHRVWATFAAFVGGVAVVTFLFAPAKALLGVIPTPGSLDELGALGKSGLESIAAQATPADATVGIMYLVCVGVAGIAFAADTFAFAFRAPTLTGVPLLVLLLVPTFVATGLSDAGYFALTAIAWLAILLVRAPGAGRRAAVGIGVVGLVTALIIPALIPAVEVAAPESGRVGLAAGINPIITLGNDLRRGDETLAVTYTNGSGIGEYLRLAVLDSFSGTSWTPTTVDLQPGNDVSAVGPIPGLAQGVAVTEETTKITVANVQSTWLPVPYAPRAVTGLKGEWAWDAEALSIRTDRSNARNQEYRVTSATAAPSVEELSASGTTVDPGLDRYLAVPGDLPPIVGKTALQVVADAGTNYEKAIRLQDYFTGGLFTYSETAPVKKGYDGSGASVLAAFLTAKSGYCVHFASAMAAMARTLGIPARVAVGFTPGTPVTVAGSSVTEYRVTTHNLHSWPELYFSGIGWVRFEPTPGRGIAPAFAPRTVDDPSTPNVDESKPTPVPTVAQTASPAARARPTDASASAGPVKSGPADAVPGGQLSPLTVIVPLAALLLAPCAVRAIRRQRRILLLHRGSALAGWEELRDSADDLGLRTSDARTPRQLSADLAAHLDDRGAAALGRLRDALEVAAYAERPGLAEPDDLHSVLRALRRNAGPGRRLLAAFAPRSLFAGWLPHPVAVDGE